MNLTERFLSYVAFPTTSCEDSETCPSTDSQRVLGAHLQQELQKIGMQQASMDENGYVTAMLPKTPGIIAPVIGLIAHMDTSPDCSGQDIHPRIVQYQGGDLPLSGGAVMEAALFPSLQNNIGKHLIVTDGTTLLGADDKAGIAEIVTALERVISQQLPHGEIYVGFTPDEEIGRGADRFPLSAFPCDYAYTMDGGTLGELEYENFNAASATVTVHGLNIHPGSAKDKMKNACLLAMEWNAGLPKDEIPGKTEGYEGFFHLTDMTGTVEEAVLSYIVRDHDRVSFEARKARMTALTAKLNAVYGADTFTLALRDSYYNMKEKITPHMEIIHRAEAAMKKAGMTPRIVPIRGGTDGARLSYDGLPCPNLCTGGENYHGRFEYIPVEDMEACTTMLTHLITGAVEETI